MEASLIDVWLPEPDVLILDEASVAVARERVRAVAKEASLPVLLGETMALVASELLHNHLRHASGGRFLVRVIERDGVRGLEVIAADRGAGVEDPAAAIEGAHARTSTKPSSLGAGLGAVFRLSDEVDVDIRVGEGTCIRARKLEQPPRFRSEVGIYARPCPGERTSGDDALFVRDGGCLALVVADGLGHGTKARTGAARAAALASVSRAPDETLQEAERALQETRGATVAVMRHQPQAGTLEHAGIGDVAARVECGRKTVGLPGQAGTVGVGRMRGKRIRLESVPVDAGDFVIVTTDGVASAGGAERVGLRHPILAAHALVAGYGRNTDDALAAVARLA